MSFKFSNINTPLGDMIAVADENNLHLLAFKNQKGLENKLTKISMEEGLTKPLKLITYDLQEYFLGRLKKFTTPYQHLGTPFQKRVWQELALIKYGETKSYQDQAKAIGNSLAVRAVANANANNQFAIIVPCHRVVRRNGDMGGYAGGIERKEWLLRHEENNL